MHKKLSVFFILTMFAFAPWIKGQELDSVVLHTTKLSDTVYLLLPEPGYGGNIAVLVGEDGILIVDDMLMPLTNKIRDAIESIKPGPITYLLNSHYHYDHAGGNAAFGNTSTIVAHTNVRKRLAEGREAGSQFIEGQRPTEALPVITFEQQMSFYWNGEIVDLIHLDNTSHTDGDSVIFFRDSNVVHTGDQYVNLNGFPFIDRDVGGSAIGLRDNIRMLLSMIDHKTQIIPGHGPLANKNDLQNYYKIVSDSIAFIEAHKNTGKSLEEIQEIGLPKQFSEVTGFMPAATWIGFVYPDLP